MSGIYNFLAENYAWAVAFVLIIAGIFVALISIVKPKKKKDN